MAKKSKRVVFNEEKAMKLIAILQHAVFKIDDDDKYGLNKDHNKLLIDYSEDLIWHIADKYDLDVNEGFIHPETLEFQKY